MAIRLTRVLFPALAARVVAAGSRELFTLTTVLVAVGTALVFGHFGLSMALGAFLAGMLLAESPFALQIRSDIGSLRTLFVTLFFTSIGMLANPAWLVANLVLDAVLRATHRGASGPWPLQPMKIGEGRYMVFLLLMAGFWTSFNQIFMTLPEYIRDYADTSDIIGALTPIASWITGLPEDLDAGQQYVMFYRLDCEHCHELVEVYFAGELPPCPNTPAAPSTNCRFQCAITVGCTLKAALNSLSVRTPFTASSATFALNSLLCCLRFICYPV